MTTTGPEPTFVLSTPLLGVPPEPLREGRAGVFEGIEASVKALFRGQTPGALPLAERGAAAVQTAVLHQDTELADGYRAALSGAATVGPSRARQLAAEERHAELLTGHSVDATADDQQALHGAGLSVAEIVTLSQVIAFVSFQARALATLRALRDEYPPADATELRVATARHPFTQEQLGWEPWLPPLGPEDATDEQRNALPPPRDKSRYFRLLAFDAPVLVARTATDEAIFRTPGGLPRAERELAAVVTSRINGCVYCASVHSRLASTFSHRSEDVQRLLDEGPSAAQDDRWRAIVDTAAALSQTPPRLGPSHLAALRRQQFSDLEILDLGLATAFFAWANRLMLTLGEPVFP